MAAPPPANRTTVMYMVWAKPLGILYAPASSTSTRHLIADMTVAFLRSSSGHDPLDRQLNDLIGQLAIRIVREIRPTRQGTHRGTREY